LNKITLFLPRYRDDLLASLMVLPCLVLLALKYPSCLRPPLTLVLLHVILCSYLHPLFMLLRQWRLVVVLYLDVEQQRVRLLFVLELAARQVQGVLPLLELEVHPLILGPLASLAQVLAQMPYQ
jgi:hypothetical protein